MTNTPQQNILNKLLTDKKDSKKTGGESINISKKVSSHRQKVISLRYKIYTILILLLMRVVWSQFLDTSLKQNNQIQQSLQDGEARIGGMTNKLNTYKKDSTYVSNLENNEEAIRLCINFDQGCDTLDSTIQENVEVVKAFFQIGNLHDTKMVVDEKSLLMNLDAFMTKRRNNEGNPTTTNNGVIQELIIGDPTQMSQQLYQVPVDIVVQFPDSDDLLSFILNVEDRIIADIETEALKSTPVLYNIQELSYDIVNYDQEQQVQIKMIAYYYAPDL